VNEECWRIIGERRRCTAPPVTGGHRRAPPTFVLAEPLARAAASQPFAP
jgi:hypothetical protein